MKMFRKMLIAFTALALAGGSASARCDGCGYGGYYNDPYGDPYGEYYDNAGAGAVLGFGALGAMAGAAAEQQYSQSQYAAPLCTARYYARAWRGHWVCR
jgi:hypothetical protein